MLMAALAVSKSVVLIVPSVWNVSSGLVAWAASIAASQSVTPAVAVAAVAAARVASAAVPAAAVAGVSPGAVH